MRGCCAINRIAVKDGRKPAFKECVTRLQTLKGCAWSMSVGYSRALCAVSTPFGCREILVGLTILTIERAWLSLSRESASLLDSCTA
jgi:hypothetical protein